MRLAVILLALSAPAAAGPCAGGAEVEFAGHPFLAPGCPPATPAPDSKPPKHDRKAADLSALVGRWEGIVVFANQRYEVSLELARSGKGASARFGSKNYRTHARLALTAELKPGLLGFAWRARTRMDGGAFKPLAGELRLARSEEAPFEREAWLSYKGRPGWHRLAWRLNSPESLSWRYQDLTDGLGREGSGELRRR